MRISETALRNRLFMVSSLPVQVEDGAVASLVDGEDRGEQKGVAVVEIDRGERLVFVQGAQDKKRISTGRSAYFAGVGFSSSNSGTCSLSTVVFRTGRAA